MRCPKCNSDLFKKVTEGEISYYRCSSCGYNNEEIQKRLKSYETKRNIRRK